MRSQKSQRNSTTWSLWRLRVNCNYHLIMANSKQTLITQEGRLANILATTHVAYASSHPRGSGAHSKVPTAPRSGGHSEVPTAPGSGGGLEVPTAPGSEGHLEIPPQPGSGGHLEVPTAPGSGGNRRSQPRPGLEAIRRSRFRLDLKPLGDLDSARI